MEKNNLIIVGTGIKFMSHLTTEVKACIEKSDKILYLVNEPAIEEWILTSNSNSESLEPIYTKLANRNENYLSISEYIISQLKLFKTLCVVIYGHPTVFVQPSVYAAHKASLLGYQVTVMPGISTEDALFADLIIDPGSEGCQSFEATDFLIYRRQYDPRSHLIIWQPFVIGLQGLPINHNPQIGLMVLTEYLLEKYSDNHKIILYVAAQYPTFKPKIEKIPLKELPDSKMDRLTTLYIEPVKNKQVNLEMLTKLNLKLSG